MAFQSPAQNYTEKRLELGDLVYLSPHSTYLVRSDSAFTDAGIIKGSVLAIDRALTPGDGQLVIAEVDGELVLRQLQLKPVPALRTSGKNDPVYLLNPDQPLPIWGVVAYALTDVAGQGFNGPGGD